MMNAALLLALVCVPQDWPQFRGPDAQGHSTAAAVPVRWSDGSANIKWRTAIDGLG